MSTMEPNVGLEHMSLRSKPELGSRVRCPWAEPPRCPKKGNLKASGMKKKQRSKSMGLYNRLSFSSFLNILQMEKSTGM